MPKPQISPPHPADLLDATKTLVQSNDIREALGTSERLIITLHIISEAQNGPWSRIFVWFQTTSGFTHEIAQIASPRLRMPPRPVFRWLLEVTWKSYWGPFWALERWHMASLKLRMALDATRGKLWLCSEQRCAVKIGDFVVRDFQYLQGIQEWNPHG